MIIKITNLVRHSENNSVAMVYYQVSLSKNGKTVTSDHNVSLFQKDSNDATFIPFEQLNEELIITWIKNILPENYFKEIEEDLNNQLNNPPVPPFINGLPWESK